MKLAEDGLFLCDCVCGVCVCMRACVCVCICECRTGRVVVTPL